MSGKKVKSKQEKLPSKKELEKLNRQFEVLDLYDSGLSVRRIAAHLEKTGEKHCSIGTVFSDIQEALKFGREKLRLRGENLLESQLRILDKMQTAVYPRAVRRGYPADISSMLDIMRQRDKMLNISKSEKSKTSAREALAKLLGKSPEELPKA
jgi:hypothetical protein